MKRKEVFEVFEEVSGEDCDGHYQAQSHCGVMTLDDVANRLGELLMQYTTVTRENGATWTDWNFHRENEEGYVMVHFGVRFKKEDCDSDHWNMAYPGPESGKANEGHSDELDDMAIHAANSLDVYRPGED